MSASAAFTTVEKMLKDCAPGSTVRLANHSRVVHFAGKVYPSLPKFSNIENGHIRKLVRFLGISTDCAAKHLPTVFKPESKSPEAKAAPKPAAKSKGKISTNT
jgi:hypothetical protein